jgi:UDP-glucose 4-epimerase
MTKLTVEHALADYAHAYQWSFAALRYFNASGAAADGTIGEDHTPETHLIPLIIQAALGKRKHIEIFGTDYPTPDGTCVRDYIHVVDLASAHILALGILDERSAIYNLGCGGEGYSVQEVIDAAREVTGREIATRIVPRRAGDPAVLIASSEKIKEELGWQPKFQDLRKIVDSSWKWLISHPQGYGD